MWMTAAFLPADSQPKSIGLVSGLAATWRWVCIHHMNRVNSSNGATPWWQHHKNRRGYYYYYYYAAKWAKILLELEVEGHVPQYPIAGDANMHNDRITSDSNTLFHVLIADRCPFHSTK